MFLLSPTLSHFRSTLLLFCQANKSFYFNDANVYNILYTITVFKTLTHYTDFQIFNHPTKFSLLLPAQMYSQ
jgi:hypothetical protein